MMIDLLQFDKRASSYSLNSLITRETESLIDKILMSFAAAVKEYGVEQSLPALPTPLLVPYSEQGKLGLTGHKRIGISSAKVC